MAAKKTKTTNAQKKFNAKIKKDMQDKGILPPDKSKLNRKKFIEETRREWNERDASCYLWEVYLFEAINIMLGHTERGMSTRASPEAVGAAKCLKIAMRLEEFQTMVRERGDDQYKISELYEYIKDILYA